MKKSNTLYQLLGHEKVRFVAVGVVNTSIDFIVLFTLVNMVAVPAALANIISTTTALAASYLLNKKAVFGNDGTHDVRQVVLFAAVTLCGLWVLQGAVIAISAPLLQRYVGDATGLLVAKLVATLFSLVWNYLWYSRVVFRQQNVSKK